MKTSFIDLYVFTGFGMLLIVQDLRILIYIFKQDCYNIDNNNNIDNVKVLNIPLAIQQRGACTPQLYNITLYSAWIYYLT